LQQNKAVLYAALRGSGLPEKFQYLIMAMAMIETNSMSLSERDASKSGGAENFGILNCNVDLKNRALGYDVPISQDAEFGVRVYKTAFEKWGLCFVGVDV
jgi:hypothetical protein